MKCDGCGKGMVEAVGRHAWMDEHLGALRVDVLPGERWICPGCGEVVESPSLARRMEDAETGRQDALLLAMAGWDGDRLDAMLLDVGELAARLGMTVAEVEEDGRTRTLIHNTVRMDGTMGWLRESVERYKETGDGRMPLYKMCGRHGYDWMPVI